MRACACATDGAAEVEQVTRAKLCARVMLQRRLTHHAASHHNTPHLPPSGRIVGVAHASKECVQQRDNAGRHSRVLSSENISISTTQRYDYRILAARRVLRTLYAYKYVCDGSMLYKMCVISTYADVLSIVAAPAE